MVKVKCVHVSTKNKKRQYVFSGPKFSLRPRHQRAKLKKGAGETVKCLCLDNVASSSLLIREIDITTTKQIKTYEWNCS